MKFRRPVSTSPKMELLSRRSSSNPISSLRRSRSVRASLKLVSKIRSHATTTLHGSQPVVSVNPSEGVDGDKNDVNKSTGECLKIMELPRILAIMRRDDVNLEGEYRSNNKTVTSLKLTEKDEKLKISSIQNPVIAESNIPNGTKSEKFSFADRIRGRRKQKENQPKSPKTLTSSFLFRKTVGDSSFPESNAYENPTFNFDSSTSSETSPEAFNELVKNTVIFEDSDTRSETSEQNIPEEKSRPKTMDNIANFLANRRSTSIRGAKKSKGKKNQKEDINQPEISPRSPKLLDPIPERRRLASSVSTSSMFRAEFLFHLK